MAYFILSLDGGGIRGVLTAALLQEIERRKPFLEQVDLVAGTSTGGILALGLAEGLKPSALVKLYRDRGKEIFSNRDALDTLSLGTDEVFRADYGTEGVRRVLSEELHAQTLSDLKKRVLISSFDLESGFTGQWKPKFFHNYPVQGGDGAEKVVDVALRTSAAPTYFPSYQGYIDGGVVANNPAMCAVAKAVKAGQPLEQIKVLSIGTGFNPHRIGGTEHDWGKLQWGTRILSLVLEGSVDLPHYQCEQLIGKRYRRLQVELPEPYSLDDTGAVSKLLELVHRADVQKQIDDVAAFV